jgi:hypothetical protein
MVSIVKKIFAIAFLAHGVVAPVTVKLSMGLNSRDYPIEKVATEASSIEKAQSILLSARFSAEEVDSTTLIRKLSPSTGEGFWHGILSRISEDSHHIVVYGPSEYLNTHQYNIEEMCSVLSGGCFVWVSKDSGETWICYYYGVGETLEIQKEAFYCLLADDWSGLCLSMSNDSSDITTADSIDKVTTAELVEKTNKLIDS